MALKNNFLAVCVTLLNSKLLTVCVSAAVYSSYHLNIKQQHYPYMCVKNTGEVIFWCCVTNTVISHGTAIADKKEVPVCCLTLGITGKVE